MVTEGQLVEGQAFRVSTNGPGKLFLERLIEKNYVKNLYFKNIFAIKIPIIISN